MKDKSKTKKIHNKYEYKPIYCETIINHCKKGGFIETLPSSLNIPFSVLTNWSKTIQEVDDAISIGLSHTIEFWVKQLEEDLNKIDVNAIKVNIHKSLVDRCFKLYDDKIDATKFGNDNRSGIRISKNAGLLNLE